MKRIILILAAAFLFTSCFDEGNVVVTNKVNNVMLENISFGKVGLHYGILLPGESTQKINLDSRNKGISFPISGQFSFYMRAKGNMVYLKTEDIYTLHDDELLKIEITGDTKVINPLTSATRSGGESVPLRELLEE